MEEEEEGEVECEKVEEEIEEGEMLTEVPQIFLQALNGLSTYQTMRIMGKAKSSILHILIDSERTYNFLDTVVAKRLKCGVKRIPSLQVAIANGQQLDYTMVCKDFTWFVMEQQFSTDILLYPWAVVKWYL